MQHQNRQFLLTIPKGIVQVLDANKGDSIDFRINLKKGSAELVKG